MNLFERIRYLYSLASPPLRPTKVGIIKNHTYSAQTLELTVSCTPRRRKRVVFFFLFLTQVMLISSV
jgi:hypothetical protein